jgi:large subunit ribosomal protein L1
MRVRSKRYKKESEQSGTDAVSLTDAVEKIKSFKSAKFDQSMECVMQLGIDPKQADQLVGRRH